MGKKVKVMFEEQRVKKVVKDGMIPSMQERSLHGPSIQILGLNGSKRNVWT